MNTIVENLYWKLRKWIMKETSYRCVTVGEVCDKVWDCSGKTIKKDVQLFMEAVEMLWRAAHDYSFYNSEIEYEDFEERVNFYF